MHRRHGRTTPNPNGWSAHLFLHWVERGAPLRRFRLRQEGRDREAVNFSFR
jgi:hypothetical protein